MTRLSATWQALQSLRRQSLLLLDLTANTLVLGLAAVFEAAITGKVQETCYADETLSAHAWRSDQKPTWWAKWCRPAIDWMFSWQHSLPEVNAAAGVEVTSHCERAFWKKKLRMYLPKEYQSNPGEQP